MARKRRAKRMKRAMPIQNMVNTGSLGSLAAGAGKAYYVNAAHLLSMMNRKAFHQVTSSGHLKNYGLEVQVFNMKNGSTGVSTAPLAYPTYNATRAWHFARKERFAKAGFNLSELGYGSRLRFALDDTMRGLNQSTSSDMIKPSALSHSIEDKGEWDWSDVIIVPPLDSPDTGSNTITENELYDTFTLYLCGDHTVQATSDAIRYDGVGMIQSWTENRRGWASPSAEEVVQPENPLAFARMSESVSLEVSKEVSDEQQQAPPYQNLDDDDAKSAFATMYLNGQIETAFPNPTTNSDMIVAPGGVARIHIQNNDSAAAYPFVSVRIYELD